MTTTTEAHLTHRERVRTAGLSGDYWYPAFWAKDLARRQIKEVVFWKQSIAVYRDEHGTVHAVEDRCPHRQIKLSLGNVHGCNLQCAYHGWEFNGSGECVGIPHEVRSKDRPAIRVDAYPTAEKYDIIWIFPGNPVKAKLSALPKLFPLDQNWSHLSVDFVWKAHHSMILENVCDFYHEYLHRDYRPFYRAKLNSCAAIGDSIILDYETTLGGGPFVKHFANRSKVNLNKINVFFDYPHQRSDIDGKYLHWMFMRPIDEQTTHVFFIFTFASFKLPLLGWQMPRLLQEPVLKLANHLYVLPVLKQDGWILEAEQRAHADHGNRPSYEFNPFMAKARALLLRKWEEYQQSLRARLGRSGSKDIALA